MRYFLYGKFPTQLGFARFSRHRGLRPSGCILIREILARSVLSETFIPLQVFARHRHRIGCLFFILSSHFGTEIEPIVQPATTCGRSRITLYMEMNLEQ